MVDFVAFGRFDHIKGNRIERLYPSGFSLNEVLTSSSPLEDYLFSSGAHDYDTDCSVFVLPGTFMHRNPEHPLDEPVRYERDIYFAASYYRLLDSGAARGAHQISVCVGLNLPLPTVFLPIMSLCVLEATKIVAVHGVEHISIESLLRDAFAASRALLKAIVTPLVATLASPSSEASPNTSFASAACDSPEKLQPAADGAPALSSLSHINASFCTSNDDLEPVALIRYREDTAPSASTDACLTLDHMSDADICQLPGEARLLSVAIDFSTFEVPDDLGDSDAKNRRRVVVDIAVPSQRVIAAALRGLSSHVQRQRAEPAAVVSGSPATASGLQGKAENIASSVAEILHRGAYLPRSSIPRGIAGSVNELFGFGVSLSDLFRLFKEDVLLLWYALLQGKSILVVGGPAMLVAGTVLAIAKLAAPLAVPPHRIVPLATLKDLDSSRASHTISQPSEPLSPSDRRAGKTTSSDVHGSTSSPRHLELQDVDTSLDSPAAPFSGSSVPQRLRVIGTTDEFIVRDLEEDDPSDELADVDVVAFVGSSIFRHRHQAPRKFANVDTVRSQAATREPGTSWGSMLHTVASPCSCPFCPGIPCYSSSASLVNVASGGGGLSLGSRALIPVGFVHDHDLASNPPSPAARSPDDRSPYIKWIRPGGPSLSTADVTFCKKILSGIDEFARGEAWVRQSCVSITERYLRDVVTGSGGVLLRAPGEYFQRNSLCPPSLRVLRPARALDPSAPAEALPSSCLTLTSTPSPPSSASLSNAIRFPFKEGLRMPLWATLVPVIVDHLEYFIPQRTGCVATMSVRIEKRITADRKVARRSARLWVSCLAVLRTFARRLTRVEPRRFFRETERSLCPSVDIADVVTSYYVHDVVYLWDDWRLPRSGDSRTTHRTTIGGTSSLSLALHSQGVHVDSVVARYCGDISERLIALVNILTDPVANASSLRICPMLHDDGDLTDTSFTSDGEFSLISSASPQITVQSAVSTAPSTDIRNFCTEQQHFVDAFDSYAFRSLNVPQQLLITSTSAVASFEIKSQNRTSEEYVRRSTILKMPSSSPITPAGVDTQIFAANNETSSVPIVPLPATVEAPLPNVCVSSVIPSRLPSPGTLYITRSGLYFEPAGFISAVVSAFKSAASFIKSGRKERRGSDADSAASAIKVDFASLNPCILVDPQDNLVCIPIEAIRDVAVDCTSSLHGAGTIRIFTLPGDVASFRVGFGDGSRSGPGADGIGFLVMLLLERTLILLRSPSLLHISSPNKFTSSKSGAVVIPCRCVPSMDNFVERDGEGKPVTTDIVYEVNRRYPIIGWSSKLLPGDPHLYSDLSGLRSRKALRMPMSHHSDSQNLGVGPLDGGRPCLCWEWIGLWRAGQWTYAPTAATHPSLWLPEDMDAHLKPKDLVLRRRMWSRSRVLMTSKLVYGDSTVLSNRSNAQRTPCPCFPDPDVSCASTPGSTIRSVVVSTTLPSDVAATCDDLQSPAPAHGLTSSDIGNLSQISAGAESSDDDVLFGSMPQKRRSTSPPPEDDTAAAPR